jgi:hypothetical protein
MRVCVRERLRGFRFENFVGDGVEADLEGAQGSPEGSSYVLQCWYDLVQRRSALFFFIVCVFVDFLRVFFFPLLDLWAFRDCVMPKFLFFYFFILLCKWDAFLDLPGHAVRSVWMFVWIMNFVCELMVDVEFLRFCQKIFLS